MMFSAGVMITETIFFRSIPPFKDGVGKMNMVMDNEESYINWEAYNDYTEKKDISKYQMKLKF